MKSLSFSICVLLFFNIIVMAKDVGLFSEANEDFKPAIEFDPNFEDDFLDIEQGNETTTSIGNLIHEQNDVFSERDLARKQNDISLFLGNETIASVYHAVIFPECRFTWRNIYSHLGLPLRFPVYDNVDIKLAHDRRSGFVGAENLITPRARDFRNFFDIERIIRHFEVNKAKDKYFLRLSRNQTFSLGQGELVRNMEASGLYDFDNLFMSGHVHIDGVNISGFLGPLIKASILGLNTRFMPFLSLNQVPLVLRDMNVDISYVNDFFAPNQMHQDGDYYLLDKERRLIKRDHGMAQGLVIGSALKYYPIPWLSLKPYVSFSQLWLTGITDKNNDTSFSYGGAFHFGHDLNIEFETERPSLLSFKSEGRFFSKNYFPGYFGSSYFIDRQIFIDPDPITNKPPVTKSQYVHDISNEGFRFGYFFELGYAYEEAFIGTLGYENARILKGWSSIAPLRRLRFMSTILGLDKIRIYLSYQATSIKHLEEVFDFQKSRGLLSLRGQLKLISFLYFDTWVKHSFGIYDMFTKSGTKNDTDPVWLSDRLEREALNFGFGIEFFKRF